MNPPTRDDDGTLRAPQSPLWAPDPGPLTPTPPPTVRPNPFPADTAPQEATP